MNLILINNTKKNWYLKVWGFFCFFVIACLMLMYIHFETSSTKIYSINSLKKLLYFNVFMAVEAVQVVSFPPWFSRKPLA